MVSFLAMSIRTSELVAVWSVLACLDKGVDKQSKPSAIKLVPDEQTTPIVVRDPLDRKYHDQYHLLINTGIILVLAGSAVGVGSCHLQ